MFAGGAAACSSGCAMKHASKKLINSTAEILNRHLAKEDDVASILTDPRVCQLLNEILAENAEGGRLVSAVEDDGTLLGFVPRTLVPGAPPIEEIAAPPASPEDAS